MSGLTYAARIISQCLWEHGPRSAEALVTETGLDLASVREAIATLDQRGVLRVVNAGVPHDGKGSEAQVAILEDMR